MPNTTTEPVTLPSLLLTNIAPHVAAAGILVNLFGPLALAAYAIISLALSTAHAAYAPYFMQAKAENTETNTNTEYIHTTVIHFVNCMDTPEPTISIGWLDDHAASVGGLTPEQSTLLINSRLTTDLSSDGFNAILAHEIAHVNQDNGLVSLGIVVFRSLSFIALATALYWLPSTAHTFATLAGMTALTVSWNLLYTFMQRQYEYEADATAVKTTGNPHALATALTTITNSPQYPVKQPADTQYKHITQLFISHPPLEKRIQAIHAHHPSPQKQRVV